MADGSGKGGRLGDHARAVADRLIEQLKAGTAPWQRPWGPGREPSMPYNPTTGKSYRGGNALWLMAQGRSDPRWMTYRQAGAEGAHVKKGEHGTPIEYWVREDKKLLKDHEGKPILDPHGNKQTVSVDYDRPRVMHFTVFNAEQVDGLPKLEPKAAPHEWERQARAEAILQASGARIEHRDGDRAFYSSATDSITLPECGQFQSADRYYATALHELGHWTAHPDRLNRDLSGGFGSEKYAKEELRAEISSMMVGDQLCIGHDPGQHAAYVQSWIKALQDDPREIFRAARDAEKINDYVMAFEPGYQREQQEGSTAETAAPQQTAEPKAPGREAVAAGMDDGGMEIG